MGNDLTQWRSAIGMFYTRCHPLKLKYNLSWYPLLCFLMYLKSLHKHLVNLAIGRIMQIFSVNIAFYVFSYSLLLQSGDVEVNPGPDTQQSALAICHLNIRSIRNKFEFILTTLIDFDILCFTETHLSNAVQTSDLTLDGFEMYRKDKTPHSGGILTYVSSEFLSKRRPDLESIHIETVWIEVKYSNSTFLICNVYRPPNSLVSFWHHLSVTIELALESASNIIIVGDINEDQLNPNNNKLRQIMLLNNLTNSIHEPTRISQISSTLLDPILTSDTVKTLNSGVTDVPHSISDHKYTYVYVHFPYSIQKCITRKVWLYKKGNFDLLNEMITNEDWSFIDSNDINSATREFTKTLLKLMEKCIPHKEVTIRKNDKLWYDSELRKISRKRDRQKTIAVQKNNDHQWKKYKCLRNKVNNLKKYAKDKFYNNLEETVETASSSDPKLYWKFLRTFMKNNKSTDSVPPLLTNVNGVETLFSTDEEKANCLNDFFASVSNLDDTNAHLPHLSYLCDSRLSNIKISEEEIIDNIKCLKTNKAVGEDLISHKVLKETSNAISKPLCRLFNKSLSCCVFPNMWKQALVMPLFKKGSSNLVTNFRPISLLSCIGKLMERVMYKHIYNYLIANNLIYSKQSGFLNGHSTVYQLIDLYDQMTQSLDSRQNTCIVFCDISKAFDRVWHKGLTFKLNQNGINGNLLKWIESYLNGRSQKTFVGTSSSKTRTLNAGVPQGSVLGPLFFLVFVNDIVNKLLSTTRLFADDTSIACTAPNLTDLEGILNHDLNFISQWSKQWLVNFNPNKTEALFITNNRNVNKPMLLFDNVPVQFVEHHKHLGLTLSRDCKWHEHINGLITKSSKILGMIKKLKFSVKRSTLNQIYVSFLRPILEYASTVWDGCTLYEKEGLEKIQHEAARTVTGLTRSVSISNLYKEIGWLSLHDRRKYQKLVLTFKLKHNLTPSYLSNLFPNTVESRSYNLRNANDFIVQARRTEIYSKSFVPSSISLWNDLPRDVQDIDSIVSFKQAITALYFSVPPIPPFYCVGERYYSVIHCRIRNGCSNLKHDLLKNHLSDNEHCNCGYEREDAEHFFLVCNLYHDARLKLFRTTRKFHPLNCQTLLSGSNRLDDADNHMLMLSVQTYIKDTGRFKATSVLDNSQT